MAEARSLGCSNATTSAMRSLCGRVSASSGRTSAFASASADRRRLGVGWSARPIRPSTPGHKSVVGSRSRSLRAITVTRRSSWRTVRHSSHSARCASQAAWSAGDSSPSWKSDSRSVQCVLTGVSPFRQVRAQGHASAVELRLRRSDRNPEHFANLLVPIAFDIVQDEHRSCAGW